MQRRCKADLLIDNKLSDFGRITCLSEAATARKLSRSAEILVAVWEAGSVRSKSGIFEPPSQPTSDLLFRLCITTNTNTNNYQTALDVIYN